METQLTQLVETLTKQTKGKSPSTDEHINVLEVVEEKVETEEVSGFDKPSEWDMGGGCPTKLSDPGNFVIEVTIGESPLMGAVLDMGASINMMPLEVFDKLKIKPLKPTSMTLTMANNSPTTPVGVIEEVHVNVHGLVVPMDFVVLDTKRGETNRQWQLLFGRSFMATASMVVDIRSWNISFNYGGRSVSFKVDRPKENDENDCLVLETPKSRRKKNRVLTLIQAFDGVADMKKGNEDCFVEQEEIRLQEEEVATVANEEIGELERERTKSSH